MKLLVKTFVLCVISLSIVIVGVFAWLNQIKASGSIQGYIHEVDYINGSTKITFSSPNGVLIVNETVPTLQLGKKYRAYWYQLNNGRVLADFELID